MTKYTAAIIASCFASCDGTEYINYNPIFEKYHPKSNEYRTELAKQILQRDFKQIDYYINGYDEIDNIPYLIINMSGSGLCAVGYLNVNNTARMEQFKRVNCRSYHGTGLVGLKYHIDSTDGSYNLIFDDVDWIID